MKLCPKCQKHFSDDANFCPVDAARLVPLEAQGTADSLSTKFDLGEKLGGSRTGSVHRATDKSTGAKCVVKLVSPAVVALPGVAQRIERELKQLERVQSVGVCRVLASGKRGDEYWLATELLEGAQTLAEAITARGPIPIDQAAHLIECVGEALIEAAQVGVVHRDLAPKNILFAGQDIKLINFSLPVPGERVPGVAEFVAPEQVEGRPVDQRSNLYSLGALYYYVLTGQTVFAGTPDEVYKQHAAGQIKPPSQLTQLPQPLEAVIMRALDRSPTKRFLTVRQFVDEVGRVGHTEVIELKQTVPMGKAGRPKGELVQTLLGVRSGPGGTFAIASSAPAPAPAPPPAAAKTVGGMAAAIATPAVAMPPLSSPAPAATEPSRSPWAPPSGQAAPKAPAAPTVPVAPVQAKPAAPVVVAPPVVAPPVVAPPVVAPPVVASPVVAAPVVAAPVVAAPVVAQPAGKKKESEDSKGKFRETMWFKKGELDAQAAVAAAEERARTGKEVLDKADSKAMDERYNDDGSITRGDKEKYSLRTGGTSMMPSIKDRTKASASVKVSEDELIGEMKKGRSVVLFGIFLAVVAIAGVVYFFFLR